ncbi:hypothetical protein Tco_0028555, partial [Tanacetum coccineum]
LDKDLFDTYGKTYSLKRDREDKDKDEDPPAGLDQGMKKRKTKTEDTEMPQNQLSNLGNTYDQSNVDAASKSDWFMKPERSLKPDPDWNTKKSIYFRPPQTWISKIAKAEKPPLTFDELMSTHIEFSAYVINNLKSILLDQLLIFSKRHGKAEWNSNIISKNVIKLSPIDLTGLTLKDSITPPFCQI